MNKLGVTQVNRVKLAGAFGSYIDPQYAMILGLIPDCDLERVSAIGNAAGDGATIALLNVEQRQLAQMAVRSIDYVETAVAPNFQDEFVAAMGLPHSIDPYPHLASLLPVSIFATHAPRRERRRNRSRKGA
jgi:uncharacterized 2Fe-2S/4Fe-4S cluster protein (DUF4445 family)